MRLRYIPPRMPGTTSQSAGRSLLACEGMSREEIVSILDAAERYRAMIDRREQSDLLRGKTVVNAFFEHSTRTRTSFEMAAKRLGAMVVNFDPGLSSTAKGETLADTVRTLDAMGVDSMVVRHASGGSAAFVARHVRAAVVNAGDGRHEHPTQALLDAMTIRRALGSVEKKRVAIVGDVLHSRVARSNVHVLRALGAEVVLVGPRSMAPTDLGSALSSKIFNDLREGVAGADVIMTLRIQLERHARAQFPGGGEYARLFGITPARLEWAKKDGKVLVMHPGPCNRGVEVSREMLNDERCLMLEQVSNGVAVRMAVLARACGGGQ